MFDHFRAQVMEALERQPRIAQRTWRTHQVPEVIPVGVEGWPLVRLHNLMVQNHRQNQLMSSAIRSRGVIPGEWGRVVGGRRMSYSRAHHCADRQGHFSSGRSGSRPARGWRNNSRRHGAANSRRSRDARSDAERHQANTGLMRPTNAGSSFVPDTVRGCGSCG